MTDAYLMDADCIHGIVWYDCRECEPTEEELLKAALNAEQNDD